jgi:hypothetical protein
MGRRLEAWLEVIAGAAAYNARVIRQETYIISHDRIDLALGGDPADPFSAPVENIRIDQDGFHFTA